MGVYLKITAGVLLIMHAFHPALLQETTDSPGRTIDKSWLRGLAKNTADNQNSAAGEEEEYDHDHIPDTTTAEPSNDYGGVASGYMAIDHSMPENQTSEDPITTTLASELPDITASATTTTITIDNTNSSQVNMTQAEEETTIATQNSTSFPDFSNRTVLQSTTLAPESNSTQETTTKSAEDTGLTNTTGSTNTTAITTKLIPEINETTTTSSTTSYPSETTKINSETTTEIIPETTTEIIPETTTEIIPETTTVDVMDAPDIGNKAADDVASGSSSERGLASDARENNRRAAWAAVLGTALAVSCVGLVAYIILKKKRQKAFSHRKLVEEYPSDPVLRLDNSEPLDLNFGGSAYYNPGLQGDNIQMTNFPGHHRN